MAWSRDRPGHQPGLDGLRGLAVALVLVFHGGFVWARGGFLGVSLFFTLSGFLITRLLLDEWCRDQRVDLRRFWGRRVRRLLPASTLAMVLIVVLDGLVWKRQPGPLRLDILFASANLANWRLAFSGRSYADLFVAPSPMLHYWSLAIEEQFYLLYPVGLAVLLGLRRSTRALARALAIGFLFAVVCSVGLSLTGRDDLAYYATPARAAEVLAGAILAVGVHRRHWRRQLASPRPRDRFLPGLVGFGGLGAIVAATALVGKDWTGLARGGLAAFSILSVMTIWAATQPGPFARTLAVWPLAALGTISYGVYLFHWPIFLWLHPGTLGLDGLALFALRIAVTLALAVASFHLLEMPIRERRMLAGRVVVVGPVVAGGIVTTLLVATTVIDAGTATTRADFSALPWSTRSALSSASMAGAARPSGARGNASLPATVTTPPPTTLAPPPNLAVTPPVTNTPPVTAVPAFIPVAVFGDSTAFRTGWGLAIWGRSNGELDVVGGDVGIGCGVGRGGLVRYGSQKPAPARAKCRDWATEWPAVLRATPVSMALVQYGPWDVADRRLPGERTWRHVGDPTYDRYLLDEMTAAVDVLAANGVTSIVWLTSPHIDVGEDQVPPPDPPYSVSEPARMDRFNQLLGQLAKIRPIVHLVDLAGHLRTLPGGEMDATLRPDGVHFTNETATDLAGWLGPAVLAAR